MAVNDPLPPRIPTMIQSPTLTTDPDGTNKVFPLGP